MILIIAAIVVATAAGIGAERRWPERAGHDSRRALVWILYLVLPPVTFFNLVHVSFDADLGGGIGSAGSRPRSRRSPPGASGRASSS